MDKMKSKKGLSMTSTPSLILVIIVAIIVIGLFFLFFASYGTSDSATKYTEHEYSTFPDKFMAIDTILDYNLVDNKQLEVYQDNLFTKNELDKHSDTITKFDLDSTYTYKEAIKEIYLSNDDPPWYLIYPTENYAIMFTDKNYFSGYSQNRYMAINNLYTFCEYYVTIWHYDGSKPKIEYLG